MYLLDVDTSLKSLCPTHSATRYARPARSATPIVRLRGGSRNSPKLKSHQWLSATHPHDQNYETGSPCVPYFEIPLYGEAVTKKEPIANFALRQSRTRKNIQSGGKNALFCKLPNTIFSAYLRDTPPVHVAYRRVSREIAPAHMFISALVPAAASLFAPVAPRDAPKTANVCRGGAHHYFRGNVQRVANSSVALARPECRARGVSLTAMYAKHAVSASLSGRQNRGVERRTRRRAATTVTRANGSASEDSASSDSGDAPTFQGAPMSPGSGHGQMLAHVLDAEPQLFEAAVEATLDRMIDELDQAEAADGSIDVSQSQDEKDKGAMVLFKRIEQMKALERRSGVQDVMYANILQKFLTIGVDMLPPLDDEDVLLRGVDLTKLTSGVHSVEALEMVKEHLMGMLGPQTQNAYSNTLVRMSKLQCAQMYAASIMFGYFLRKADKRFKLDRAMGTLPMNPLDSAKALEELFNSASAMDSMDEADGPGIGGFANAEFPGASGVFDVDDKGNATEELGSKDSSSGNSPGSSTLKQYIQSFDQNALAETARIVSMEGVTLAERQTGALFGSIEDLAMEMQRALEEGGEPITSPDDLMLRVQDVVGGGKVKTLTLPVATQRRVVLEAVAFGTFLRDAETYVDTRDGRLLTPVKTGPAGPPGLLGA